MRLHLFLAIVCGVSITAIGCGGGDSDGGGSVASNSAASAPPPPPGAPAAPAAPTTGGTDSQASGEAAASADGGTPGGTSPEAAGGYPGGYPPAGAGGYPPPGAGGYPPAGAGGYPPAGAGGYPGAPDSAGGYPGAPGAEGYPGSDGAGFAAAPPRPKSLREKAVDAFREGRSDEGVQLLSAHYLTTPTAGAELGRVMQWSPNLRKPHLLSRIGIAVVYISQPATYEGHPQPIGSPELEAALGGQEKAGEGGGREGGNRRVGGLRRGGRGGEGNAEGGGLPPPGAPGASGYGGSGEGGQNNLPTTPREELAYFTGELGTKLEEKLRAKLESGAFGVIYREALKSLPLAEPAQEEGADARMRPPSGGPGFGPGGAVPGIADPGGRDGGGDDKDQGGGIHTGQIIPGVEFLGAAENVKELGEMIKSSSVDAVVYFEVRVRPATAVAFVNNDTRFRVVAAADPSKHLYSSPVLNNKQVYEARKKRGAEDPVAKEIDAVVATLETNFKLVPLPALTSEQAMGRLKFLLGQNPEDATSLLLEGRLFVAKKLLKPEDVVALALTQVTEDQVGALSEVLEGEDVKEKIGAAISGKRADAPTTVLGKFGAAVSGAGGLSGLVPAPRLPGGFAPPATGPGGYGPPGSGPGGYGPPGPGSGTPMPLPLGPGSAPGEVRSGPPGAPTTP
ncbi:MAG: hypothetical protein L0211_01990 [Planctomycetaceae bacterium]|nr:hypothetical protein [Planctomycetaceae bacterium]